MIDKIPRAVSLGAIATAKGATSAAALFATCWTFVVTGCDEWNGGGAVEPLWSVRLGGDGFQVPTAVVETPSAVVVAGVYNGAFTLNQQRWSGAGGLDGFVLGLDGSGKVSWAYPLAGAGDDAIVDLTVDSSGAVFAAGYVTSGAKLGDRAIDGTAMSSAFFAKFAPTGTPEWAFPAGGTGFQAATAVEVSRDGAVYFSGDFGADIDLGMGPATASDGGDAFIARFKSTGELEWFEVVSGAGVQHASGLASTEDGGVVLAGSYSDSLTIDTESRLGNPISDVAPFAAKFTASGKVEWIETSIVPLGLNHVGHPDHVNAHHSTVFQDIAVSSSPGGKVVTSLDYGSVFGLQSPDFEAPSVNSVFTTERREDGTLTGFHDLIADGANIKISRTIPEDGTTRFLASWVGEVAMSGQKLTSARRSLLFWEAAEGAAGFQNPRAFRVEGADLTISDTARGHGSVLVSAAWTDTDTGDSDVFVARFP